MEEIAPGLDPDELMDLEDAEGSDLDDDDDDLIDESLRSPFQFPSSGSAATSAASSPPNADDLPLPFGFYGKPLGVKRGRGRPRREGCDLRLPDPEMASRLAGMLSGKPAQRRPSNTNRIRKIKPPGYPRKKLKSLDRFEFDLSCITPSPGDEMPLVDPETGALIFTEREKPAPVFEELPYFPEQWPGKVCALCNLGERSQLGQGDMLRLLCPENFTPQRVSSGSVENLCSSIQAIEREAGDKSPRGPVTCRRQKSFNKCRHPSLTSEYVDELTIIGYTEEPDVSTLFDASGYFYTHRSCALWSNSVTRNENSALENVGPVVLQSSSRKCSFCNHYGASTMCKVEGCTKFYHFPCATASGAFQVLNTLAVFCCNHIGQASLECENAVCYTCKSLGDIANLMYCSSCGEHYHGICVGLAQLPGVRAGWQCRKCRICQVCRMIGDETKLMTCEQCDKIYHSTCQRPIVTSIPKYGWKCRCCRVCGDCGSRTPGAGLSSRWHAHYTVCDSCYQQRNKGFSCPLCHRAYRAHAHREMVQCTLCRKFVHGTCDPEADLVTYHQRKESHPEYEYVCLMCKNLTQPASLISKRNSIDDSTESASLSQESTFEDNAEFEAVYQADAIRSMGLGKGKPYSASKIAKKRLGLGNARPKGVGKTVPGKVGFMKRQRMTEFGRKRGPKAKMRGVFGVPGVGLQRPVADGKNDEEPGVENRLVLCSAKDKFVLTQDICVMCGALGTDQEGCLIACVQCGQCYHPYCVNVKVTKVILQKGWRCLDCTVCEGCGQRNDEGRLILCDDCDISYHIYCMDPPLDYVPHGNWKCKWCAICQSCGATDPGFNCTWMNSFNECGPCASHVNCPSCSEPYSEGDLIIQCVQCERWLHGACDAIKTEEEAEKCAEEGYNCMLCRPRDVPPPHLVPSATAYKPPTPTKSPEVKSNNNYYVDGVYLSESGFSHIKSLSLEQNGTRKKRKKLATVQDKEAGIMATIESVVAGGSTDNMLEDSAKLELVDIKEEPQEIYKEGMIWVKDDGPPPDGFTIFTMENGISVLRRKRQRNLQKLGIGGFVVRMRGRNGQDNDDIDVLPGQSNAPDLPVALPVDNEKPRRKPVRRKPKSKLAESFPPYLQEAFFGKELLDSTKEIDSSSSDEEKNYSDVDKTIQLTQDEIKAVAAVSAKHEIEAGNRSVKHEMKQPRMKEEEDDENTEDLKDVLAIPGDLLDTDLVNTIMNEGDNEMNKNTESLDALSGPNLSERNVINPNLATPSTSKDTKDELSDILGPHFNLESMPNINGKDVEDIFKGVLTDDSQESQESNVFPLQNANSYPGNAPQTITQHPVSTPPVRPPTLSTVQSNMNSPLNFPPQSPYQSEYSNSPQFSPAFSEPPSPWVSVNDSADLDTPPAGAQSTYNQRSSEKMKADEGLGNGATISAVLYANINHTEWKTEFPNWSDRYKQILKKWRTLSSEQKAPYLQQARDNRSALRMKKQQQINKDTSSVTAAPTPPKPQAVVAAAAPPVSNIIIPTTPTPVSAVVAPVSEDQEKVALQRKSAHEAEQERQWKQLQALRQQQAQQQQNVIHEQRVQCTIARVQRQISDPTPFSQEQTPQELSPVPSPSPNPRQLLSMGIKSPTFPLPQATPMRPPPPAQTPLEFAPDNDPYNKPPSTPKIPPPQPNFQVRLPADPYAHQPSTPRPQFPIRPPLQAMSAAAAAVVRGESPELNRQLRDLLQRQQQFKKLDDQVLVGKGQQRVWPPAESSQEIETPSVIGNIVNPGEATFRQPLPPSIARPRLPLAVAGIPRPPVPHLGLRMQLDPRIPQVLDPRMRLLIQQQKLLQQQNTAAAQQQQQQQQQQPPPPPPQSQMFQGGAVRFAGIVRPTSVEQFEQLSPRPQPAFQPKPAEQQMQQRLPVNQIGTIQRQALLQTSAPTAPTTTETPSSSSDQEIPDNVTAELEKLEQETGTMAELQGVSDILGGLGEDDDELLAEMGADFNILEYADPEALPGEKTNILDLELEEEPIKNDKKVKMEVPKPPVPKPVQVKEEVGSPQALPPQTLAQNIHPPPLAISQGQNVHPPIPGVVSHLTPQQIHQQMLHQVQQAAARGKPMPPGSKLQTPDGIIGIVTPNNSVQLQIPQGYQRLLVSQLQNQKLQMRLQQNVPRMMSVAPLQQALHAAPLNLNQGPRMGVAAPPPPPPPYPGPPPPYPGSSTTPQKQDQPLLLEDLLEQEKREQEKQNQNQTVVNNPEIPGPTPNVEQESLLTDHDFDRLSDALGSPVGINPNARQGPVAANPAQPNWTQNQNRPKTAPTPQPTTEIRVQTFNANLLTPPPLPPENIVTEQDKQKQLVYEQWLSHQNNTLTQQLKYYETEVNKLRKMRKSLNSKQRQLRKSGGQLADADANELQRIAAEQAILQKHLESSRKASRQHGLLIQEYRNKQQAKQRPGPGQSPLLIQQNHSPLGPPSSSPIHHSNASHSPMMSPSASPLTQHSSPMHSPSPMISHSPGPGSVANVLQSPNGMSPMQPSPRIGTPHSQGDGSPGPVPSPSQICLPPPAPRMTSPQHKRVVTSPVGYVGDLRPGVSQMRFVRPPMDHTGGLQRRLPSPMIAGYQQKPGTPSPLSSPPPQQMIINQQLIQKQLEAAQDNSNILNSQRAAQMIQQRNLVRQQLAAQQQQQQQLAAQQQQQQQQLVAQQQQQQQQQALGQPQPLTPQQHQMMIQQQQQLAKQQQQQIAQMQAQLRLNQQQNNAPTSPMPPKSPLISQQIMSPHSMPPSPMPPRSPMMNFNNGQQMPNSPAQRNAGFHQNVNPPSSPMTPSQYQPPSPMIHSPMGMRRPPSANSSPAMPDRPTSVENPHARTPYGPQSLMDGSGMMDNQSGGGNPNNPNNPIPAPPGFGRFGYFKLGLRGGSPMWSFGRGAKRIPTPPGSTKELDKNTIGECSSPVKPRKESHLSKVSILKRKSPAKTNLQSLAVSKVSSLVSTDYNEFDDSSCTPPVTPPPANRVQKSIGKKVPELQETKEINQVMIVHSPGGKQMRCDDLMDYDDDNNTVVSGEVSLSAAAQQNDSDDIAVIETFSQNDISEAMSSPLESDQMADEYLLFPGNMVVDLSNETHYSDKEEEAEEEYGSENINVVIRSPTTSDDEFIMQSKTKKYNIRRLPGNHLLETADSPEQEEMQTDPSPEATDEDAITNYEESEIVIIDSSIKSPEEQISTKEDFEELIDEGSRKEKMVKQEVITAKHINEIHKYAANVYSFPPKTDAIASTASRVTSLITSKLGQKISLITTTPVVTISRNDSSKINDVTVNQASKLCSTAATSKVTNIILHNAVRSNVLNVPKLMTSGSSSITIVSANTSPIASILPPGFTVPVISASAVRQLPNVKVIDKPSSSISLTKHDNCLPKKIFEESLSGDSNSAEDKPKDSNENAKNDLIQAVSKAVSDTTVSNKRVSPDVVIEQKPTVAEVKAKEAPTEPGFTKLENANVSNVKVHTGVTSPVISKTSSPVIIHNTPELKMTAQVIQESQSGIQITAHAETVDGFEGNTNDDTKSVVISIPSPTPSQEQMLDNIALQALEHRRRDGNGMAGEFESFEDVLDMIENITGEPPTVLEDNIKDKLLSDVSDLKKTKTADEDECKEILPEAQATSKPSVVPQLSPLSQPTDLTTNMANASQQLRTLLSLHTTTAASSTSAESIAKTINKIVTTASMLTATTVPAPRVIQQAAATSSVSTVIVQKQKAILTSIATPVRTQTTVQNVATNNACLQIANPGLNFLPARTNSIQLMPEHPKLPRVTAVTTSSPPIMTTAQKPVATITPTATTTTAMTTTASSVESVESTSRKSTCSLTEMLQSHPAAVPTTKTNADTITAASLLGTPINLTRSGFTTSLVQAQPHVVVSPVTSNNLVFHTSSFNVSSSTPSIPSTISCFKPATSNTNLLHTQLTKVMRQKSEESNESKPEDCNKIESALAPLEDKIKIEPSGCKYSTVQTNINRNEDSQNALLKKLLQNTACASAQTPPPSSVATSSIAVAAPIQFTSTLENQLKASILPPVSKEASVAQPKMQQQRPPIVTRETSFVSGALVQQPQTAPPAAATQQLHIDIKKCMTPTRTPSRDELLSPPTPRSSCSQDSSLQTPPLIVKKEMPSQCMQQFSHEVKKEFVDETSQHSEVSDQSRCDVPMKEELDALDPMSEKSLLDQKEELKKQKRRMYQQKRRQNQIMNKEAVMQPKKRPRKSSKVDEDYDTYIDGVLAQLRTLPPMVVSEPILNRNFNILPVFGSDLNKLTANDYDTRFGELKGGYGNAVVPGCSDFYNTQPYGDKEPLPEKPPTSTQRGFYDQEFPLIKFDAEEDKRFDMFCRDDSPDSIISSSSPECMVIEPSHKFLGLKLINEDDDEDEEEEEEDMTKMRLSPIVPIIAPIPIRLKPAGPYLKDYTEDKENVGRDVCLKSKFGQTPAVPLKDSGNVTVTLTLTSSAAEDIMGVLRDLANILHIPAPTSYQIVERTSTPPSQKLGLYRTKGKDGKEGAPIDIQSILNGAAKFCKHCDVVILNNMIRKKVSELPFLTKDSELLSDGDELFFCSTACYMQFALMHRSPAIPEDKAAAIIDHLCQKDKGDFKNKRPLLIDSLDPKRSFMDKVEMELHYFKREIEPIDDVKSRSLFAKTGDVRMRRYDDSQITPKVWRGVRYKSWTPGCLQPPTKHKKLTDKETMELLYRLGITVMPPKLPDDFRRCMFCQGVGDGVADGPARLLNFDVDKWVHLNCGLWSDGVYETVNGALMNLENALQQSLTQMCVHCSKLGATIRCFKTRCSNVYHLACAVKDGCVFYKNKTTFCTVHVPKNEKDNELTTLSVSRRVYVNRDENRQVAAVMHHSDTNNLLRVGSLIFLSVGQLLPHQLQNFHTQNFIYPIGYKIIRFYWSMRHLNKRCKYICSIHELFGRPEFRIIVQEAMEEDVEFKDCSPKLVWHRILEQIAAMRRENQCVQLFPQFVSGEDLFGLTEPAVVRVLESLPGIETLTDYKFKYGRNPLLELPLAINPSGAARTEPRLRNQLHWKRPHTQRTGGSSVRPLFGSTPTLTNNNSLGEACPYTKQFVHSKSSQYKKMKQEWRNNVYLARSKIQGLGLYAARDLEKHTMVIEYIGEIIRTELAETREKKYEAKNRGIYMFRLDEERVVDATLCGGLARYINHSCNPNCVAETVEVDRDYRIIIFAKRRIQRGEELAYDYKFDIEDDQHKISCMCGAPNCRKWMN